jgi:GAF domain-containing protein
MAGPSFESIREKMTNILLMTPEERMYADVLDLLLQGFESEFGYFGYISEAGDLVCPSMTRNIFPQCQVPDKDIVFRRATWDGISGGGGLWGRILRERVSLIKNEAHGVPMGHLPIHRSFGSPILYRGELIGQFHFANRGHDYDAGDVALLEDVCGFVAPVLNARLRRDEEERARRNAEDELRDANLQLQTKVRELERLNEALIDREERMIELKAELERLRRNPS